MERADQESLEIRDGGMHLRRGNGLRLDPFFEGQDNVRVQPSKRSTAFMACEATLELTVHVQENQISPCAVR